MSASSFLIRELTGEKHSIELQGRALPYRPISFEGTMRSESTFYPGNPVGTMQVLGAQESPSTFNGMWKDRFIKALSDQLVPVAQTGLVKSDGSVVADVWSAAKAVDAIRLRGQLVEVTWDEEVRHGILKRFKKTWHRREDLEWEMEFDFISRGEPLIPIAFSFEVPSLDIANEILSAIEALENLVKAPFALLSEIRNTVNEAISQIQEAGAALAQTANNLTNEVLSPLSVAQNAVGALSTIKDQATRVMNTFQSVPGRVLRVAEDVASVSFGEDLEAEDYARQARKAARALRAIAAQRRQELLDKAIDQPLASSFLARQSMDLRDISTRFYGTPDEWRSIATYNGFSTSRLEAGQIVLVPKSPSTSTVPSGT